MHFDASLLVSAAPRRPRRAQILDRTWNELFWLGGLAVVVCGVVVVAAVVAMAALGGAS